MRIFLELSGLDSQLNVLYILVNFVFKDDDRADGTRLSLKTVATNKHIVYPPGDI